MSRRRKGNNGCLFWFLDMFSSKPNGKNDDWFYPPPGSTYADKNNNTNYTSSRTQDHEEKNYSYRRKYLLTKNEYCFYKELKKVADKLNLTVLAKIRMADLVEPKGNRKDSFGGFGKIKAKHIDFALCDPENLYVVLLIELDDKSHDTPKRIKRDKFIENVYEATGYTLYRARGTANLERDIAEIINSQK